MSAAQRDRRASDLESEPAALAASIYRFRRRRAEIFADSGLFGEPAYDILLDLYIAHYEGRQVTISDACNAADVPWATALRKVRMLHERGFVSKLADRNDRRRFYLALEPRTLGALDRLLSGGNLI